MKHLILLLLTITHGGHWLAGHTETITAAWPLESGMPASTLHWECTLGSVSLASGTAVMSDAAHPMAIRIVAPKVRTMTDLTCQIKASSGAILLGQCDTQIRIYPDEPVGDFSSEYSGKVVMLLARDDGLHTLLGHAKVPFQAIPDISRSQMARPDVLIIGPDELDASPLYEPPLQQMARAGTRILVFRQSKIRFLAGYAISRREIKNDLVWRTNHPLLAGFDEPTLNAWVAEAPSEAIQIPANSSCIEVAHWRTEANDNTLIPLDSLLFTQTLGSGRIILCQLPASDWNNDPRSRMLLGNSLAYIATRPEPAPATEMRQSVAGAPAPHVRNILVCPGAQP